MIYDTLVRVLLAVTQTHTRAHSFILLRRECSTRHGVPWSRIFFSYLQPTGKQYRCEMSKKTRSSNSITP